MALKVAGYDPSKLFSSDQQLYTFDTRLGPTGDFAKIEGPDVVLTNCAHILGTIRGTRILDRSAGTELVKYCFMPLDHDTIESIREEIIESLTSQEDRVQVNRVEIYKLANDQGIEIKVFLNIMGFNQEQVLHAQITPDAFNVLNPTPV